MNPIFGVSTACSDSARAGRRRLRPHRDQRGGALVLAIVAVVIVGVVSASFLALSSAITRRNALAIDQERSFYLAEAGLGEAYSGVAFGKSGNVGSKASPAVFGDGLFWVEAEVLDGGAVQLSSTGMCGRGSATLSLVVEMGEIDPASLGVFSLGDLIIEPGTLIDSYDSARGGYKPPPPGQGLGLAKKGDARVRSNGSITVRDAPGQSTTIAGNIAPGPKGSLTLEGSPTITGDTDPSPSEIKIPETKPPKVDMRNGITHDDPLPLMIRSGEFGYESLDVAADSDLILAGPLTLVLDTFHVEPSGSLSFDTTEGPIKIFVNDALAWDVGALVSNTIEDAGLVSVYFTGKTDDGEPVILGGTGAFYGAIIGPEASMQVDSSFELFGAIVAGNLHLAPNARLHFDTFLNLLAEVRIQPSFLSWRLETFADPVPGTKFADPFMKLGVVRNALLSPDQAHADQLLEIKYLNHSGVLVSYTGMESAFDWTDVDVVVGGYRDGQFAALSGPDGAMLVK